MSDVKWKAVHSAWLEEGGRRLDCNPYMSGALEARDALKRLSCRKDKLRDVTTAMFDSGRESRKWVSDSRFGTRFMGSTAIGLAEMSKLPLIANKQVARNPKLVLEHGWSLITRSGSIGRMAYVRPDMVGLACSEDVLRVVPDTSLIPSGYLYAFLSSRYGVPLVVAGTYGAIIQHIEPEHIADLPVPRFGAAFEAEIHQLIDESARLRSAANETLSETLAELEVAAGFSMVELPQVTELSCSSVMLSSLNDRFDAPYHSAAALSAEKMLDRSPLGVASLPDVVKRYFKPPIFKRLWVDGEEYGRQFVSGVDIYRYQSEEPRYVSSRTPKFNEFLLERGMVVFQAAGQIYGLFARPLYVNGWLEGAFCADDVFRIAPFTEEDGAFLYLFLRTKVGEALIKRQACGNSIPRVWEPHISRLRVLWPEPAVRKSFAKPVIEAHEMIEQARQAELKAVRLLEQKIKGGT